MKIRFHPRDRLWFLADSNLEKLIIKCEMYVAGSINIEQLRQLIKEQIVNKYSKFHWVINPDSTIKYQDDLDFSYHITQDQEINLLKDKPLWRFNISKDQEDTKIEFHIHHCLLDGLSLVSLLRQLAKANVSDHFLTKPLRKQFSPGIAFGVGIGVIKTLLRILFAKTNHELKTGTKLTSSSRPILTGQSVVTDFEDVLAETVKKKITSPKSLIGVPVSMVTNSQRVKAGLGNFFAFLPLTVDRGEHIFSDLKTKKKTREVLSTYLVSMFIGSLPLKLGKYFVKFISSHIFGVISGVYVSSNVLKILDKEITRINAWAPILDGQHFSITTVTYNRQITINEVSRV